MNKKGISKPMKKKVHGVVLRDVARVVKELPDFKNNPKINVTLIQEVIRSGLIVLTREYPRERIVSTIDRYEELGNGRKGI